MNSQWQQIEAYCNGELAASEFAEFEKILLNDSALRSALRQYLSLDAALRHDAELVEGLVIAWGEKIPHRESNVPGAVEDRAAGSSLKLSRVSTWLRYSAVVAATILLSFAGQLAWRAWQDASTTAERPWLAHVTAARAIVWEAGQTSRTGGDYLRDETLKLRTGELELAFVGGPQIKLVGPAEFQIHSATAATLRSGQLIFRNDQADSTFDLRTPYSELVDLGTSYDVTLSAGFEEVRVFDGEVWRTPRNNVDAAVLIDAGSALRFGETLPLFGEKLATGEKRPPIPVAQAAELRPESNTSGNAVEFGPWDPFDYADGFYAPDKTLAGGGGWSSPWQWHARDRAGNVVDNAPLSITNHAVVGSGIFFLQRRFVRPIALADDGVTWFCVGFHWEGAPNSQDTLFVTLRRHEQALAGDPAERFVVLLRGGRRDILTRFGGVTQRRPLSFESGQQHQLVGWIESHRDRPDRISLTLLAGDGLPPSPPEKWAIATQPIESAGAFDSLNFHIQSTTPIHIGPVRVASDWSTLAGPSPATKP